MSRQRLGVWEATRSTCSKYENILLVPTALSAVGSQLFKSMELRDTTSSTKYPVSNPHQGKYRVEVSRYLSNSQYTGNSAKAWYLLADPNDLPVIEVAFLNGQESPTIESAEGTFPCWGFSSEASMISEQI